MDWKIDYKSMNASQLSDEYQRLLTTNKHDDAKADKLYFLKCEFKLKVKR